MSFRELITRLLHARRENSSCFLSALEGSDTIVYCKGTLGKDTIHHRLSSLRHICVRMYAPETSACRVIGRWNGFSSLFYLKASVCIYNIRLEWQEELSDIHL